MLPTATKNDDNEEEEDEETQQMHSVQRSMNE
jgi:hypothetical protein